MLLDGQRTVDGDLGGAAAARRAGDCRTGARVRRAARRGRLSRGSARRASPRANAEQRSGHGHCGSRCTRAARIPTALDALPRMLADAYVHADGPGSTAGAARSDDRPPPARRDRARTSTCIAARRPTAGRTRRSPKHSRPSCTSCSAPATRPWPARSPRRTSRTTRRSAHVPTDAAFVDARAASLGHATCSRASSRTPTSTRSSSRRSTCARSGSRRPWCRSCATRCTAWCPGRTRRRATWRSCAELRRRAASRRCARTGAAITIIAAVDLAHIGRRFGDAWLVDASRRAQVERADLEMLELALAPDAEAFFDHVMRDRDARRICGFTPIYLLSALMQRENRLATCCATPVGRHRRQLERHLRQRDLCLISVQEATRRANPGTWLPRPGHPSGRSRRPRQPAEQRTASVSLNHVEVAARRVKTS